MRKIAKYKPVLSKRWLLKVTGKLSHGLEGTADTILPTCSYQCAAVCILHGKMHFLEPNNIQLF